MLVFISMIIVIPHRLINWIDGSDLDTRSDLFKVLPEDSYDLIFLDVVEEGEYFYRIQLKKKN